MADQTTNWWPAEAEIPAFVVCEFRGVWKVGKYDPNASFGLPKKFVGEFETEEDAEEYAQKCERAATPGWVRYLRGERTL